MENEIKLPALPWLLNFLKLVPVLAGVLAAGIAIGDWRSNQSAAIEAVSRNLVTVSTRLEQVERSQIATGDAVTGLKQRVDDMHEMLLVRK